MYETLASDVMEVAEGVDISLLNFTSRPGFGLRDRNFIFLLLDLLAHFYKEILKWLVVISIRRRRRS